MKTFCNIWRFYNGVFNSSFLHVGTTSKSRSCDRIFYSLKRFLSLSELVRVDVQLPMEDNKDQISAALDCFVTGRISFNSNLLLASDPPCFVNKKKTIYDLIFSPFEHPTYELHFVKYSAIPLDIVRTVCQSPSKLGTVFKAQAYDYDTSHKDEGVEGALALHWHVNFADPELFACYSSVSL